ncbi:uncharacterized protein DEA37_0009760 [Paragonimus westermani]|uniref:Uncharacterized protein n=1 Tax=Paragonimus westermani TaxID=34504 RepID=A0A5J4NBE4_9TREM|nr:uncharacterized protein DEA37_0009760 [Paragonimus westermani]
MNAKDHVEPQEHSGVLHATPCVGRDQQYVGKTGKQLRTRVHEPKLTMRRADPRSQLWHHCADTGHEVNVDHAKVVARAKMKGERFVLEALYSRNSFSRHVDVDSHYVSIVDVKGDQPIGATLHCVDQFTCNCNESYIGRTERCLISRLKEHLPKWVQDSVLRKNDNVVETRRQPASAVARHVLTTGHVIDPICAFRILLRHSNPRFLRFAEAVAINRLKPHFGMFEHTYFPFLGQPGYLAPLVAVQFKSVTSHMAILVECQLRNLKNAYESQLAFELMVD